MWYLGSRYITVPCVSLPLLDHKTLLLLLLLRRLLLLLLHNISIYSNIPNPSLSPPTTTHHYLTLPSLFYYYSKNWCFPTATACSCSIIKIHKLPSFGCHGYENLDDAAAAINGLHPPPPPFFFSFPSLTTSLLYIYQIIYTF